MSFHGKNEGQKEIILKRKKKFNNNFQTYFEKDIIQNSETFFNEVYSKSFFEKEKLLIIKNTTDKFILNIKEIIKRNIGEILIVCISDILEKKSKLRSLFEKDENLISLAFYPDNIQTLLSFTNNFFKERNISLSFETINLIVNKTNGERKFLVNELEKLSYFLKIKKLFQITKLIN